MHYRRWSIYGDPLKVAFIRGDPEKNYWSKVTKTKKCWKWRGQTDKDGYAKIFVNGKNIGAHRFSWELHYGKIPKGLEVCHHCDNPPCTNPKHLFLGTKQDNANDSKQKGRRAFGERSGMAVLTSAQVEQIRKQYQFGSHATGTTGLAKKFGVSQYCIWSIVNNKSRLHG